MSDTSRLEGRFELGIVDSIDSTTRRGMVKSVETGGTQSCVFNASPFGGHVPGVGALVAIYRKRGYYARYLFTVSEMVDDTVLSDADKINDGEEPAGVSPQVDIGDTFIGRYGRFLSDDQGNVTMYTESGGQQLTLSDSNNNASLSAWNFKVLTPGNGILISTSSSVPDTFGDSITISKNVPVPLLPDEILTTPTVLTNISSIGIDAAGGITLSSLAGLASLQLSAPMFLLGPDVPGRVLLGNSTSSLTLEATGSISLKNAQCGIDLESVTGNASISSLMGSVSLTSIGKTVDITGAGGVSLLSPKGVSISGLTVQVAGILEGKIPALGMSFFGAPASIPLISQTAIALIPVMVNGILAGHIPVIA